MNGYEGNLVQVASVDNYLREQLDFSPVTKAKRRTLLRYIEGERQLNKPLVLATREELVALVDRMFNGTWDRRSTKAGGVREVRLKNRSPRNYALALMTYYRWVKGAFPEFEDPMRNLKIPKGKLEQERPVLVNRDLERLVKSFDNHWEVGFYHVLLIAGHHMMRAHEILPYRMDQPKTICDCKGECTLLHDFRIKERPHQIMFRVKGMPGVVRYSEWEESTPQEVAWLREAVAEPPCTADTGTRWLGDKARSLGIRLVNKDGIEVPLGFHILTKHTLITRLVERKQHPAVVNAAAHWSKGSRMWARYAHPDSGSVEEAKAEAFPSILGGRRKKGIPIT